MDGDGEIRPARPEDADVLVAVWRAANDARGVGSPPEHEEIVRGELGRATTTALVLVDASDRALGFVTSEPRVIAGTEMPGATQVRSLFVDPVAQGRGAGSRLLAAVAADAADRGRPEVHLWVRAANDGARRLYERFGFRAVAEDVMQGGVVITAYVRPAPG